MVFKFDLIHKNEILMNQNDKNVIVKVDIHLATAFPTQAKC
jgi:hypothetical protein